MTKQHCPFLNPLQRDGTSQNQRLLDALLPENTPIDDRSFSDMLVYAHKYAQLLRYYNETNTAAGDWVSFIENDVSTNVALISVSEFKKHKIEFDKTIKTMEHGDYTESLYAELFTSLFKLIKQMGQWFQQSEKGQALHTILARLQGVITEIIASSPPSSNISDVSRVWFLTGISAGTQYPTIEPADTVAIISSKLELASKSIVRNMNLLIETATFAVEHATEYLQETLENHPEHQPQMALLLAFLHLFKYAQDHLNSLTDKHLSFYYEDILQLQRKSEQPDQVHLVFELAKQLCQHDLGKDTFVKAGKDPEGNNLFYATDEELVVNKATLDETHGLKTVFVKKNGTNIVDIYAAPIANSSDGLGEAIQDEEGKWATFGSETMPAATLGFAVASPMFLLAEGERTITLRFNVKSLPGALNKIIKETQDILQNSINVYASGEKEWIPLPITSIQVAGTKKNKILKKTKPYIEFILTLKTDKPAVTTYSDKVFTEGFSTKHPVIKFEFANANENTKTINPYTYFKDLRVDNLAIDIDVTGVKNLILENDLGILNPAKPFLPFGPTPKRSSKFYIGSNEVFQKALNYLNIEVTWGDLPETSFETHYSAYKDKDDKEIVDNNCYFLAIMSLLYKGKWEAENDQKKRLFNSTLTEKAKENINAINVTRPFYYLRKFNRPEAFTPFTQFSNSLQYGFIRFDLQQSFLHKHYPKFLAKAVKPGSSADVPNQPYTPLITAISLNYKSNQTISFTATSNKTSTQKAAQLFQITPFGQTSFSDKSPYLVSHLPVSGNTLATAEGSLFIGIKDLQAPQNLSLLFQVAEGSANPDKKVEPVSWAYLVNNDWVDFKKSEIISDKTNGLLTSGITRFSIPKYISKNNTMLPSGLHWIKASVENNSDAISQVIAIIPQAVIASFRNDHNDLSHLETALPAETISKLKNRTASIRKVIQPYASFDGQLPETDKAFYRRVSERLRHKNRAITIFDYERLVLEKFPQVYKIKCINHTDKLSEYIPGSVRLIVVPDLRNKNAIDPLQPRLPQNTLLEIKNYLSRLASNFASIIVTNPKYEAIKVHLKVIFQADRDEGFYMQQLQIDIIRFLSPWLYDDVTDLSFGGRIHRTWILNHIEELEYIDYITDFSMDHIVDIENGTGTKNVEEASVKSSSSVLVSYMEHDIKLGNKLECRLNKPELTDG